MQSFIKLQSIINDPKRTFLEFKQQLINSQITQFTYLCLLLNIAATIKRSNFHFQQYMNLLVNFKTQGGYRSACINYTGYKDKVSILMNACQKSVCTTVRVLATHPDIKLHIVDPNGFNAAFYAIKNTDENEGVRILQLLYDLSPQIINSVTNNGYSLLFLAVQKYRVKCIEFLLHHGIDPSQKLVSSGNTGLHQMVKIASKYSIQQTRKVIEIFLRYGFNLNTRNNQQKTVQEYGLQHRFNLSQILVEIQQLNQTKVKEQQNDYQSYTQYQQQMSQTTTTQIYSSKLATTTRFGDILTTYQQSQIQQHENQIDTLSIMSNNKSLLSQEVNCFRHQHDNDYYDDDDQSQLSLDMNLVNFNNNKNDDFDLSQNLFDRNNQSENISHNLNDDGENDGDNVSCQSSSSLSQEDEQQDGQFLKTQHIDFMKIHNEILQFDEISQQIYFSAWREIEPFFIKLTQLTFGMGLSIEVIGSFATGLWTHHSDIDIALITQTDNYVDFQRLLQKVYSKIKVKMYDMGIRQLSFNKASKIPSLKIQMDPYLFSSRKIDIMIFHKKNMAITYVNYIRQALTIYYQIRPLFFFLKRACEQFGLHDPFNGGMKSYSIFLLINSIIRSLELTNLGEILLKISLYFGFYHTYDYEIEHHHNMNFKDKQEQYVAVQRLNIKDPLNNKNNMGGKNTNVLRLKNMFRTIYYGIHQRNLHQTALQHILEMAQLIV